MNLQSRFGSLSFCFFLFRLFLVIFQFYRKWGSSLYVCSLRLIYLRIFSKKGEKNKTNKHMILHTLERCFNSAIYEISIRILEIVTRRILQRFVLYLSSSSAGSSELMNLLFCLDFLHFVSGFCFVFFFIIITLDIAPPTLHAPRTTPSSFQSFNFLFTS